MQVDWRLRGFVVPTLLYLFPLLVSFFHCLSRIHLWTTPPSLEAASSQARGAVDVRGTSEDPAGLVHSSCGDTDLDERAGIVAPVKVGAAIQEEEHCQNRTAPDTLCGRTRRNKLCGRRLRSRLRGRTRRSRVCGRRRRCRLYGRRQRSSLWLKVVSRSWNRLASR